MTATTLAVVNLAICGTAVGLGWYVLIKDLKVFTKASKTPTVDSWLVFVGVLGWGVALYMAIDAIYGHMWHDEPVRIYGGNVFARVLLLIYWIGDLLKIQEHCKLNFKKLLQQRRQERQEQKEVSKS